VTSPNGVFLPVIPAQAGIQRFYESLLRLHPGQQTKRHMKAVADCCFPLHVIPAQAGISFCSHLSVQNTQLGSLYANWDACMCRYDSCEIIFKCRPVTAPDTLSIEHWINVLTVMDSSSCTSYIPSDEILRAPKRPPLDLCGLVFGITFQEHRKELNKSKLASEHELAFW